MLCKLCKRNKKYWHTLCFSNVSARENEQSFCSQEQNIFSRGFHAEGSHFSKVLSFLCEGLRVHRLFQETTASSGLSISYSCLRQSYPKVPPGLCATMWCAMDNTTYVGTHTHAGLGNQTNQTVEPHILWRTVEGREGSPDSVSLLLWLTPNTCSTFFYHSTQSKCLMMPSLPKQCQTQVFKLWAWGGQFTFKSQQHVLPHCHPPFLI